MAYKRGVGRGALSIKFDQKEFQEVDRKLKSMIEAALPEVSMAVTKDAFKLVQSSGNVPYKSGTLKNSGFVMADKFGRNYAVMGWTTPYARARFFGVGGKRDWAKDSEGKRRGYASFKNATGTGIPFWTSPIVQNKSLMMALYTKHIKARKELK